MAHEMHDEPVDVWNLPIGQSVQVPRPAVANLPFEQVEHDSAQASANVPTPQSMQPLNPVEL
jgi:hypothetical protein